MLAPALRYVGTNIAASIRKACI